MPKNVGRARNRSPRGAPAMHPQVRPRTFDSSRPALFGDLAVDRLQGGRRVPFAGDLILREGGLELCDVRGGQVNLYSSRVLFEILPAFGSGDRDQVLSLGQDPCEGELTGLDAATTGDGTNAVYEDLILIEVLA